MEKIPGYKIKYSPSPRTAVYQDYYSTPGVRSLCHNIKQNHNSTLHTQAIRLMAKYFIQLGVVRKNDFLIPAPQHTGKSEYTKEVANLVAHFTGAKVLDILVCNPRATLYEMKKARKPIQPQLSLLDEVPKGGTMFLLDNVIATGATFLEARGLLGQNLAPLVYAIDFNNLQQELKKEFLTLGTPIGNQNTF